MQNKLTSEVLSQNLRSIANNFLHSEDFTCVHCGEEYGGGAWTTGNVCIKCFKYIETKKHYERNRIMEFIKVLGGNGIYEKANFASLHRELMNANAFDACEKFNPKADNLFLWGLCGRGKTIMAKAALKARALLGETVAIETTATLSRKTRGRDGDVEQKMVDAFCAVDVFLLDDLGRGNVTPTMISILCEVLDNRYDNGKHGFIATSNASMKDLALALGDDRLTSRLYGYCKVIEVGGKDYRVQK